MKICHIISGDLWAGAEVMAFRLLNGLMNIEDLELFAILFNEGRLSRELKNLGITLFIVNEKELNSFQLLGQIKKIISKISPDILHSHRYKENILAYLTVKLGNKKIFLVSTQHGMPELLHLGHRVIKHTLLLKYNQRVLKTHFDRIVVVSEDLREQFNRSYHFPEGKVKLIYNGTAILGDTEPGKEKDQFVIGSAGRFFPVKDYPLFVEVARELLKRTNGVRFELAGDGPERGRIEELVTIYGLEDKFIMQGFVSDMDTFYQSLDIYLNTSVNEGLPMSVLEAMSRGLPVVAPNIGGLKELITDGSEGFLIEGREPANYAEKCIEIIRDEKLKIRMGIASRNKFIDNFSSNIMVEKYYTLYVDLIKVDEFK